MLSIYVTYDSGIGRIEERAIKDALKEFSSTIRGVPIINFGSKPWTTQSEPYSSADWYIKNTPKVMGKYGSWQLDGDALIDLIEGEPWQVTNPHIDVFLTSKDMTAHDNGAQLNFVFGVASHHVTVQSLARYRDLDNYDRHFAIKAVIHHELGHIFGMASDLSRPHTEYLLGPHCTNYGCVMRQGLTVPDWVEHARAAYTHGIYCPECLTDATLPVL